MSRRDPSDDESLSDLLDSLEGTLSTLREELGDESGARPPTPFGDRRPPRPPRMRDILRFTDEYTIPTLVAILEANVRLLKLAQAGIRAVDPERSVFSDSGQTTLSSDLRRAAGDAGRLSADRLASSLSDLQRALEEADTPENPEARDLLTDARSLSAEIETRLRESREQTDLSQYDRRNWWNDELRDSAPEGASKPVRIEVSDEDDEGEERDGGDERDEQDEPDVDVDAELDSIKRQMGKVEQDEPGDDHEDGTESEHDGADDTDSAAGADDENRV